MKKLALLIILSLCMPLMATSAEIGSNQNDLFNQQEIAITEITAESTTAKAWFAFNMPANKIHGQSMQSKTTPFLMASINDSILFGSIMNRGSAIAPLIVCRFLDKKVCEVTTTKIGGRAISPHIV